MFGGRGRSLQSGKFPPRDDCFVPDIARSQLGDIA